MVVELIGPLVDDAGAVGRTLADVLTDAGLDLLPGALDQVAGMSPNHALRTLAEGHGRFELVESLDRLVARTAPALASWAARGEARAAPGAIAAWGALATPGTERAVLTTLPADLAATVAERIGFSVAPHEWIVADDSRGPPHPDHVVRHRTGRGEVAEAVALVQSVGAALAAAAAGCRVVAVGGRGGASLFADMQVTTIGDYR